MTIGGAPTFSDREKTDIFGGITARVPVSGNVGYAPQEMVAGSKRNGYETAETAVGTT
jgi:hypothetical protein